MSTLFSIIVPTLNEQEYLPLLLSDIEKQITKDYEVIVVDAHSTDATKEKALSFGKRIPLAFTQSPKKNVSFQRNFGAKRASGEYYIFLDADVRIPKEFLTHIKAALQKKNNGIFLPYMLPDDTSQKTKMLISFVNTLIRLSQTYGKPLAPGGNLIVKSDIFKKVGGFSEDMFISEDHNFVRSAYRLGYKAKILSHAKVQISMRRTKIEGDMTFIYKYVIAFLMYTMTPNQKVLEKKLFDYEMGGQMYGEKLQEKLKEKTQKHSAQMMQLSKAIDALRYFNRF